ncbi:site-specific tyrosine recombinase XerC [Thalassoglobus neptunius]|uniref:Site-specific tyrosine recombinase XerC n=1 Tax=Thalassoglobus neptunius TaxID=1938619 RepID=A0A5C5W933_9PLAN|nr:tyrosine-type recombinase/integrase [Thalassoglobus neptunius]TWT47170.1 site-specific tyrosine recombinase XerC [Thalassoglobus neptunius]
MIIKSSTSLTLREAFESYHRCRQHKARTIEDYYTALNHWERETVNPDVSQLTNLDLRRFREALLDHVPDGGINPLKPTTVAKYLREIQAIFVTLGPPGPRCPDSLGIIQQVPYCKKPLVGDTDVITATIEEIEAIYEACQVAQWPRKVTEEIDDTTLRVIRIDSAHWWRTLLVYLYNIGSRLNEFLTLKTEWVDLQRGRLKIDPEKNGARNYKPINAALADHLERLLQAPREYVFACPKNSKKLYEVWYAIQAEAGIQVDREKGSRRVPFYGFHEIRKTCGTTWADFSEKAAQHMLGHKSINTTRKHYLNGSSIASKIEIPQPGAFIREEESTPPPPKNDGPPVLRVVG